MVDKKINASKNKDGTKKVGTLSKYMKAPFMVLCMARDFYVRSIIECSGRARYGPSSKSQLQVVLPKSLSTSSSKTTILYTDEDLRDLIRAASTRSLNKDNTKLGIPEGRYGYYRNGSRNIARSLTSGIGRIEEDKTCEFGEDVRVDVMKINTLYPRSQSEAVARRR